MVLNEEMGDEVKVTVIATGFSREGAEPPRKVEVPRAAKPVLAPVIVHEPEPEPQAVPVRTEILYSAVIEAEPVEFEPQHPIAPHVPEPAPIVMEPMVMETQPLNDYDTPAFLRRNRRLFQ
jgi:hypothetical protein